MANGHGGSPATEKQRGRWTRQLRYTEAAIGRGLDELERLRAKAARIRLELDKIGGPADE